MEWHWGLTWLSWTFLHLTILKFVYQRPWMCVHCYNTKNYILVQIWGSTFDSKHVNYHLLDGYSFTHVEQGLLFGLLTLKLSVPLVFLIALCAAIAWEALENHPCSINKYKEQTDGHYEGDSVLNSFGDVVSCLLGVNCALLVLSHFKTNNGNNGVGVILLLVLILEISCLRFMRDSFVVTTFQFIWPWKHHLIPLNQWQAKGPGDLHKQHQNNFDINYKHKDHKHPCHHCQHECMMTQELKML
jgi:hypothetical protein